MTAPVDPDLAEALAVKLFAAIAANDAEALRNEVYAPDIQVWHNNDRHAQDIELNLKVLNFLHRKLPDKRYEEVRRQATPTGFVEQHVLRATGPGGDPIDIPACLVVTITGDRISRIDEYLDSAHVAAITG